MVKDADDFIAFAKDGVDCTQEMIRTRLLFYSVGSALKSSEQVKKSSSRQQAPDCSFSSSLNSATKTADLRR